MAEYSNPGTQTVAPGETVVFTLTRVPCRRGFVRHRDGTGNFLLSGGPVIRGGCCCNQNERKYLIDMKANIAVSEGETVGPISLAYSVDGATDAASIVTSTPDAVGEYNSVSVAMEIPVWNGCCESFAIRNISAISVDVNAALVNITRRE